MFVRRLSMVVSLTALAFVTACSAPARRDDRAVYGPTESRSQVPAYAQYGRVENIGTVQTSARPSGAGAVIGAVLGAVVGNQIGSGSGKAVATGAGAIGGAVAGNAVEGRTRRGDEVYRVQVRFDNGSVREFDFQRIDDLRVGDRVRYENGELYRV